MTLVAAAAAALAGAGQRTAVFVAADGRRYVAKRLAAQSRGRLQTLFMWCLLRGVTGQRLPLATLALSGAAQSMDYEATRLTQLAQAGVRVPQIAARGADFLVLEHCGTTLAEALEGWDETAWTAQLLAAAGELAALHAAGQWHGGAQIKNLTLQDGQHWRIDFEERFGESLPLPITQATDLLLFLNSIILAGPLDAAASQRLLPLLCATYFSGHPDPAVPAVLRQALPWLCRLVGWVRPWQSSRRKGIRRAVILAAGLRAVLRQA